MFQGGEGLRKRIVWIDPNMIYACSLSMSMQCDNYLREWNNITAFRIKIRYSMKLKYKVVFNKSSHLLKWLWLPFVFLMDSMWRLKRLNKKWLNQRNMESSIWWRMTWIQIKSCLISGKRLFFKIPAWIIWSFSKVCFRLRSKDLVSIGNNTTFCNRCQCVLTAKRVIGLRRWGGLRLGIRHTVQVICGI